MSGMTVPALGGLTIYRGDTAQRRRSRRRMAGILVIALVAGSGALVNALQAKVAFESRTTTATAEMAPAGPFSYFPR